MHKGEELFLFDYYVDADKIIIDNSNLENFHNVALSVVIGNKGEFILNDSLKKLNLYKERFEKIPVIVSKKARKWINFVSKIKKYCSNKIYQPFGHQDLDKDYIIQRKCSDRFDMILNNIIIGKGKVLDLGGNIGFFTIELSKLGYQVTIIESEIRYISILKHIKDFFGYKYKIFGKSIFLFPIKKKNYEIVLALSLFHHFLKEKRLYLELKLFLNNLNTKILFIEMHDFYDEQMIGTYKNYNESEFISFILTETNLNNFNEIGISDDGRKVIKFFN